MMLKDNENKIKYERLTLLPDMATFMRNAEAYFSDSYEKGLEPSMIFFDLESIRPVIARYGEDEGNRLLKDFADLLRKYFGNDHCSRPGGFCFYAFADNRGLDEDIPAIIKDMQGLSGENRIAVKAGIFNGFNKKTDNVDSACSKARFACRNNGKKNLSGIYYFDNKMDEELDIRSYVVDNIDTAIKNGDIRVYYQSQIRLLNDKFCGAEALTRWEDPVKGVIEPSSYVPILEDNNLTWKLDTFVIREVASNIRRCIDMGLNPLPIGINLTHADFLVLNIPDTVRDIVRDMNVDPSLIVIEVTEKTVLKDTELIKNDIERLHSLGFKVVIDDFGNGYSSINMLNDFRFDAIKVDMELMNSFTERSRKIVESIVSMAKSLNIHTISEGVETREQLDFLRSIGCEIVQGFYFGGVKNFDDTIKSFIDSKTAEREGSGERELFARAGLINLITDKAMALSYFNGGIFDVFFTNNEFFRLISHSGYDIDEILNGNTGDDKGPGFVSVAERIIKTGKNEDIVFSFNNHHFRLDVKLDSANDAGAILLMHLSEDLGSDEGMDEIHNAAFKDLLSSYDNIYLADIGDNSVTIIKSGYGTNIRGEKLNYETAIKGFAEDGTIYEADTERFIQFFDLQNLRKRFSDLGRGTCFNVFRMRVNGIYKWITLRCNALSDFDSNKILICITIVDGESQADLVEMSRQILGIEKTTDMVKESVSGDSESLSDAFLWNTLMEISDVKYFWKDNDRRFLGASKSFLEFYGFDSIHEILGKNDEEMGWHPDDTQYRSDEFAVLEKGAVIRNSPGQIYAKGAKVNILATKYPIYKNGRTEGLIGYFMDTDTVLESVEEMDNALFVDVETGLLNARGIFLVFRTLDDDFRINGNEYGICVVEIAEYQRIFAEFGREEAEDLTSSISNTLKRSFSESAVVARTANCTFMVADRGDAAREMEERLRDSVKRIRKANEKHGLTISTASVKGSEKGSMHELYILLMRRLNDNKTVNHAAINDDQTALGTPDVFKDMPLPFLIMRPVVTLGSTTDVKYVFANNKYCENSGFSRIDIIGKSYKDCFNDTPEWLPYAGRAANGETVTGRVYEKSFGQWMEYIATPSSNPGCCNIVFWPVEDTKNERELLTKGHAADNAIIRIARFLNTGDFEMGIYKSLSELGRVLNPDRVYMLDQGGAPLHEWCRDGVLPRKHRHNSETPDIDFDTIPYALIEDNCLVVEDIEVMRRIDPKVYEFFVWEGIRSYIVVPLYDSTNTPMGFVGVDNFNKDEIAVTRRLLEEISYFISSRLIANSLMNRLNVMSNRDNLTGLLNRNGYHSEMEAYLDNHPDDPFTLVLIDIDDFKIINDMYGHITGDEVLKNLADDLNFIFGDRAIIARTGGDELSVAIMETGAEEAGKMIKELSELEHGFTFEGNYYPFRISIGYSCYPDQSDDLSLLLRQADSALYYVKSEGKHGFRQYGPGIKLTKRLQLAFNVKNVARFVPGAILVYEANDDKKILYANDELIKMFECENMEDFMDYTNGNFDGIVHPDEIKRVDDSIWEQIDKNVSGCKDYVDYRIITKSGRIREVIDCGRYVDSEFYGKVFYVMLLDKDEWRRSKGEAGDE